MQTWVRRFGQSVGLLGIVLMAVSGGMRLAGHHRYGDFETATLLRVGSDAVVVGCFVLLWSLVRRDGH